MKTFIRLMVFLKPFSGWIIVSILLGVATVACGIGLLGTSAYLIAFAALHPSIAALQLAIVGVRFFGISRGVFRYLERLVSHRINLSLVSRIRVWFYHAIERLAPAGLEQERSGDILSRLIADIETLENFYVRVIAPYVVAFVVMTGVGLFIGQINFILGVLIFSTLFISAVVIPICFYFLSEKPSHQIVIKRAHLYSKLVENLQASSELLVYGKDTLQIDEMIKIQDELLGAQQKTVAINSGANAANFLSSHLTLLVVLLISIPMVSRGELSGITLAVLALVVMASFEAIFPLSQAAQNLGKSLLSADPLFHFADLPLKMRPVSHPLTIPNKLDIEIHNLSFRYSPRSNLALKEIDLKIPAGKHISVVGPSGSGKTTLMNILLRLREFDSGSITIGGQDIRNFDLVGVRKNLGVVSPTSYLFNTTIRQNLLLANPMATDAQIGETLSSVRLENWLNSLPDGLDTWIGEHGQHLSGGERIRLLIARMLLSNVRIWLLDEPTIYLDASTERSILQLLHEISAEKTLLWITHRMTGLENLDEIVVLNNGLIIERGTHAELLILDGIYSKMWTIQNRIMIPSGEL